MVREAERALGVFISNHPTDNARRGRVAIGVLLVGLAFAAAATPMTFAIFAERAHAVRLTGLLWGAALIGIYGGVSNGLRTLRRHGEIFVLREQGLVYRRTGETRVLPWTAIRGVVERGQDHALGRLMGWDVHTVIRIRDGKRLLLTGYTEDAARLAITIRTAVAANTP
ncbi:MULTISPECIES: hypothetical protein [Streptomyces]|uniref:hypothetical protein n=1 Tax=Streptomyces TaxID=1883 RepID=UPI000B9E8D07|nr:hypothetical protein [Streptomyces kasugaensis]